MEKVEVPAKPGRLINAVANIGYDPEVAICDLVDNCIDANAEKIHIEMEKSGNEKKGQSDTIRSYAIYDDGVGMDRDTLIGAFTLGTERDYPSGSLGKFGLGLKSAGLSLGGEIIILTKRENSSPLCAKLSISYIEQSGEYKIDLGDIPEEFLHHWEKSQIQKHGTILIIRELNENQPQYANFSNYIQRYCSIVFHRFLEKQASPIEMSIGSANLKPFDPLFLSDASKNGSLEDPKNWSGKDVRLLLQDNKIDLGGSAATITATHLVHPPSFEEKRHEIGEKYAVVTDPYTRRPRHGFYVYVVDA